MFIATPSNQSLLPTASVAVAPSAAAEFNRWASKAKHAARTDGFDSVINPASAVNYVFQSWGQRVCVS